MKNYLNRLNHAAGFTLIELLIVIGILGVLAATIVATLDPFEQVRKARDSALRDASNEFLNASVRYYISKDELPWNSTTTPASNCYSGGTTLSFIPLSSLSTCLRTLATSGELKQGFLSSSNLSLMFATNPNPQTGNPSDVIVCFKPQSKAMQKDPQTKYTQGGDSQSTGVCRFESGSTDCYWCTQ